MRKWMTATMVAAMFASASGCSVFRAIDQWKCDNLGCCMFGTTPSNQNVYAVPMAAPMAAPVAGSGCCPTALPAPCGPSF